MSLSAPTVPRLGAPRWRDPRLVLGVLLVLVSVVVGARVVAAADSTTEVWAAATDLGPGIPLRSSDLVVRRVHLDAGQERYVAARGETPVGLVLLRTVGAGELLPRAAVASKAGADLRRVSVEVSTAAGLQRGSVVEVYAVPKSGGTSPEAAGSRRIVTDVTVADVGDGGRLLGSSGRRTVTLMVPSSDVRAVLDAVAHGGVELVGLPGTGQP